MARIKSFYESASKETQKEADDFILRLKSGKIKRRILSNTSKEFDERVAFRNFKRVVKSKAFNQAIKETYK